MKIVGCDLHARQQTIAMVDTETGEFTENTLCHKGNAVREFYAALEGPVVVGIEAIGAMQWFLELLEEWGIECRVGHPAKIRAAETRKQKHDRRDARLVLDLLVIEDRFPEIWVPSNRPSVSLAAGVLQKKKLIEYTRGAVKIVNRKKLEDSACECYGVIRQYDGELGLKA